MPGEADPYVAWLKRIVAEHRELGAGALRHLLTDVVGALETGRQTFCGATVPGAAMDALVAAVLPELVAELTALGGPVPPVPPRPALWPQRARRDATALAEQLGGLPAAVLLPPFTRHVTYAVGGLLAVGIAAGTELVLVVSSDGIGVFDGTRGERVARQRGQVAMPRYPESAPGIGPLAGVEVTLMGLDGGTALSRTTPDGWQLGVLEPDGDGVIWSAPPGVRLEPPGPGSVRLGKRLEEVRAAGYSSSGRTLVVAQQHTLDLYGR